MDFKKAFDTVQRPLLWSVLSSLGVPDGYVRAVRSYYSVVQFQVDLPSGLTSPIPAGLGVKQGCPLSPVLFGVCIEAMVRDFMHHCAMLPQTCLPILGPHAPRVPPLLFADDLSLLSTTRSGLQCQADVLQSSARRYGLTIHARKTQAAAFGVPARSSAALPLIQIDNQPVDWVNQVKFLGVTIRVPTCDFTLSAENRLTAATKCYYATQRRNRELGINDHRSLSTLFDAVANSVLLYGAVLWAPDVYHNNTTGSDAALSQRIDHFHTRFQRALLALPQKVSSLLLAVETRRPPVELVLFPRVVGYVHRLHQQPKQSLLGAAYQASVRCRGDGWVSRLHRWSTKLGCRVHLHPPGSVHDRSTRAASLPFVLPTAQAASDTILTAWQEATVMELGSATGGTRLTSLDPLAPARASRYLRLYGRTLPATPSDWNRRLPSIYDQFPFVGDRGLISRARFGLLLRGFPLTQALCPANTPLCPIHPRLALTYHHLFECQAQRVDRTPGPDGLPRRVGDPFYRFEPLLRSLFPDFRPGSAARLGYETATLINLRDGNRTPTIPPKWPQFIRTAAR